MGFNVTFETGLTRRFWTAEDLIGAFYFIKGRVPDHLYFLFLCGPFGFLCLLNCDRSCWDCWSQNVINNFQKYLYLFRGSPKENKGFLWSMPVTVGCVSCSVVLFIWECVGCDQVLNEGLLYQILPCGGWNFFSVLFAPIESIILLIWGKDEQKKITSHMFVN